MSDASRAQPVQPPRRAGSGRPSWPWAAAAAGVLALAAVGAVATAALASTTAALAVALAGALLLVLLLGAALAAAARAHREAEDAVESLLLALESARDESVSDETTGLLNRRGLLLVGRQVLESARRSGGAVHACVVEVTPAVQLGGPAPGSQELREQREHREAAVAAALRGATRTSDVVARDDEGRFLVLGPGAGLHAQELERRVRVGLAQHRLQDRAQGEGGDRSARMAVEVGAAVLAPWDEGQVADLLVRAEQALAQRRALRRSTPVHGWGRRRNDRSARPERPGA